MPTGKQAGQGLADFSVFAKNDLARFCEQNFEWAGSGSKQG